MAPVWMQSRKQGVIRFLCIWLGLALELWSENGALFSANGACLPAGGCDALAWYTLTRGDQLQFIAQRFETTVAKIQQYNNISDPNFIEAGKTLRVTFQCQCLGDLMNGLFSYVVQVNDTLEWIAHTKYEDLTDPQWIATASNLSDVNQVIYAGDSLKIPVNCSCGSPDLQQFGLFLTYVVRSGDTIASIAQNFSVTQEDLTFANSGVDWNNLVANTTVVLVPARDPSGNFPPYTTVNGEDTLPASGATCHLKGGGGNHIGAIIGGTIGGLVFLAVVAIVIYIFGHRMKRKSSEHLASRVPMTPAVTRSSQELSGPLTGSYSRSDFMVVRSVEYSLEELAAATNNFSIANKVGEGGYAAVYYGEWEGQKLAVKKMNLQASKEFLAELHVLTRVHHTNLVQLVGYCTVESLFLVYEFVENGTLDQHLHKASRRGTSLTWAQRVQIALDSARGLEYIHEHTKPTYIHRDVKSANILIDNQFHAKVADFGLTKLTENSTTAASKLAGTFGYMSPEYARFGDVSAKVDVYSFGVVLYEILSAKNAIVRTYGESDTSGSQRGEQKGLVTVFETVLHGPNAKQRLPSLIDPNLGSDYPIDSAFKFAQLARACTQENPESRPNMRSVVIALMTLSSSTQDWGMDPISGDTSLSALMTGR